MIIGLTIIELIAIQFSTKGPWLRSLLSAFFSISMTLIAWFLSELFKIQLAPLVFIILLLPKSLMVKIMFPNVFFGKIFIAFLAALLGFIILAFALSVIVNPGGHLMGF